MSAGIPRRRLLRRLFTIALVSVVVVLLFNLVRNVDWREVWQALRGYSLPTLLAGLGMVLASYLLFASFDLLGRRYTGHRLPTRQVLRVAFVCYSFNLNLGSWVGSVAMRYRLYSRLGLDLPTITRILSASLVTNWLGWLLAGGLVFTLGLLDLPEHWRLGTHGLRIVGILMLLVAGFYLAACRFAQRRTWHWRAHRVTLPSLRFAATQAAMGAANWCLMAALINLLLPEQASLMAVLGILAISAIAGVVTHIPAGLGVLEAIFIALLQHQMAPSAILAALIGYRALYFLLPLAVACLVYLLIERRVSLRTPPMQRSSG
ncbi:MAG TPA: lysylphosphatidylglycerol synthase domain-containing protein [Pseudomonas sp.]|jgi:uncharacterized membrane protein YbhN (UPF0104 family)|nr:lysylphosphatidylglycerol synthase domain-containing protein [Pseudomonas sp.]